MKPNNVDDEIRLEKVIKNTFSALDQLADLFNEVRKG
jgi:hypothetical protein